MLKVIFIHMNMCRNDREVACPLQTSVRTEQRLDDSFLFVDHMNEFDSVRFFVFRLTDGHRSREEEEEKKMRET